LQLIFLDLFYQTMAVSRQNSVFVRKPLLFYDVVFNPYPIDKNLRAIYSFLYAVLQFSGPRTVIILSYYHV